MTELTIRIPKESVQTLERQAREQGVQPNELASSMLVKALAEVSEEFKRLVEQELEENAELYKRLS
jgi:lipoate-protein ligase A